MTKTIEELAEQFAKELYPEDDLDTLGDKTATYMTCAAFGNQLMSLPLKDRLSDDEKEEVKRAYTEAQNWLDEKTSFENPNVQLKMCAVAIQDRLERIFGKELFKK